MLSSYTFQVPKNTRKSVKIMIYIERWANGCSHCGFLSVNLWSLINGCPCQMDTVQPYWRKFVTIMTAHLDMLIDEALCHNHREHRISREWSSTGCLLFKIWDIPSTMINLVCFCVCMHSGCSSIFTVWCEDVHGSLISCYMLSGSSLPISIVNFWCASSQHCCATLES